MRRYALASLTHLLRLLELYRMDARDLDPRYSPVWCIAFVHWYHDIRTIRTLGPPDTSCCMDKPALALPSITKSDVLRSLITAQVQALLMVGLSKFSISQIDGMKVRVRHLWINRI